MNNRVWQSLATVLARGEPAVLMVVVSASAHSPGRQGFAMMVSARGELCGTIGGGPMEFRLVEQARCVLKQGQAASVALLPQIHRRDAGEFSSGMICRGEQLIAFCLLSPRDFPVVKRIARGTEQGTWLLTEAGLDLEATTSRAFREFTTANSESWCYKEQLGYWNQLYIIGSGHVGLALTRIASTLDFFVTTIDHRPQVQTLRENTYADRLIVAALQQLTALIPEGPNVYVVVVTTNAKTDEIALQHLIHKRLAYLGVMGSANKLTYLRDTLQQAGASQEELKGLRAPIGLPIASHSAEEIAISIAAELIKVKNLVNRLP